MQLSTIKVDKLLQLSLFQNCLYSRNANQIIGYFMTHSLQRF